MESSVARKWRCANYRACGSVRTKCALIQSKGAPIDASHRKMSRRRRPSKSLNLQGNPRSRKLAQSVLTTLTHNEKVISSILIGGSIWSL